MLAADKSMLEDYYKEHGLQARTQADRGAATPRDLVSI